jgi:NAD-dependent deacetylase
MITETLTDRIKKAAQIIKNSEYTVAFTGAGISTESGIPDFRSHDSGLWENVDAMAVASIYGFKHNPLAFYDWVAPLARTTLAAQPNGAHKALVALENAGYLRTVITQNIDMLHSRAGTTSLFEIHGHMREATCISCFKIINAESILNQFLEDGNVPRCPDCNGVMKPNVILFGEQLPIRELQGAQDAARKCDLMIIVGSSLEVAPASDIPILAKRTGAQLIIVNLDPTPADGMASVVIHGRAAEVLPQIVEQMEIAT